MPKVSVVMPVYNGARFIKESVDSILGQTYQDFELIVIDDGSSDNTLEILRSVRASRLKIITSKDNLGLAKALNKGLEAAEGIYIARCDADDINLPERFIKQVKFLDSHPDYILVGSNADLIDINGKTIGETIFPETDKELRKGMIVRNIVIHPSVMMRTSVMKKLGGYRLLFNGGSEDYDLWFRMLKQGKIYNMQEHLIKRRIYGGGHTQKHHIRVELLVMITRLIHLPYYIRKVAFAR